MIIIFGMIASIKKDTAVPPPDYIVWDWNGTLQDDVQAAVNGINMLLQQRNMPFVSVKQHREKFTFPVSDYYRELGFKLEDENWDEMAHQFIDAFANDPSIRLFSGTVPTLTHFKKQGIEMSILSACREDVLEDALDRNGIRSFFKSVKGQSNASAESKKMLAVELFNDLNVDTENVWIVGDTTHDKEVADEVGCNCILVTSGYQSYSRLIQCNCPVIESVADVPSFFGTFAPNN
ncbi:MAG: HAD family hydrolase [Lentisphaerae bacterium]|nr:HAD family hydrolase [Lentisphaerota bacterium]